MKIDSKAPTGFILDFSLLKDTIDADEVLSPLSWQYVIEQDLMNQGGLLVIPSVDLYESLIEQIRLIYFLQKQVNRTIINCIPNELLPFLHGIEVKILIMENRLYIEKR